MSTYEDYGSASCHYDKTRIPIGSDILTGCLSACGMPLEDIRLLDAGCGTGAYSQVFVDRVAHIDAIDINEGMLAITRHKLAKAIQHSRLTLHRGSIDALPFRNDMFDAVMLNQVLHHLENGKDKHYPGHRRVLSELFRVLRPGGVAVINLCSHEQLTQGFWYVDLVPEALQAVLRRCIPMEQFIAILDGCGFQFDGRIVPLDAVMQGEAYFNRLGPLDPEWRRGDSLWALATPEQINQAEEHIRSLRDQEQLETYFLTKDARRQQIGQITFCLAGKL